MKPFSLSTPMETPRYLLELLETELREVQSELLRKVANKYGLSHTDLVEEFLAPRLKLIPNSHEKITVKKQKNPKPPAPDEERCHARIWNRGKGGQCTKRHIKGEDYCMAHKEKRKHGDIRDTVQRELFPARSSVFYK